MEFCVSLSSLEPNYVRLISHLRLRSHLADHGNLAVSGKPGRSRKRSMVVLEAGRKPTDKMLMQLSELVLMSQWRRLAAVR